MITCRECGAPIDDLAERCPYCGAVNEAGAEHKYMKDMYDLKDDLKEVGNIPKEEIGQEVKTNVRFTGKVIIILLVLALLLAGILFFFLHVGDAVDSLYGMVTHTRSADMREQMKWDRENLPKLDAWYEAEDYDAILDFCHKTDEAEDGISYSYTGWEHWNLMPFYETYQEYREFEQRMQAGEQPELYEFQSFLYDALTMSDDKSWFHQADEKDESLVDSWIEETMQFVRETYQMSDQEIKELEDRAGKKDFLDYKVVYKYVEEHKDRLLVVDERNMGE